MATATLIITGSVLSVFGCLIVYYRRVRLTLIDLYVFFVAQYFGLLSVIDGFLNKVDQYDFENIFYVHFFVFISINIILLAGKIRQINKSIKFFSLKEMIAIGKSLSINRSRFVIVFLFILHIIVRLTIINEYNDGSNLIENLSYLSFSVLSLYRSAYFISVIFSFIIILSVVKEKKRYYFFDIIVFLLLFEGVSQFGRTYSFNVAFICFALYATSFFKRISFNKFLVFCLISLISVVIFSNFYQTYRGGKNSTINTVEAALNFNATLDNLRVRLPMWRFNYAIAKSRWLYNNGPDYPGQISIKIAAAAIPSLLFPGVEKIVGDSEISTLFNLVPQDYPSNIYATFLADFGCISTVFVPLLILTVVGIFYKICRVATQKYPQVTLFYFCLLWQHLSFVEAEFVVVPLLFRDVIIFGIIISSFIMVEKIFLLQNRKKNQVNIQKLI